jgi:hypothetical protein
MNLAFVKNGDVACDGLSYVLDNIGNLLILLLSADGRSVL